MTWWMWLLIVLVVVLAIFVGWLYEEVAPAIITLGIGGLIVGFTILITFAVQEESRWGDWCRSQGGHVVEDTDVFNTFDGKNVGIGVTSTSYCLTDDGRIIDIYG